MNFKGFPIMMLISFFCFGITFSSNAASSISNSKTESYNTTAKKSNFLSNATNSIKHNLRTARKYVSKTYKKVRKQQHDAQGLKKAGWGLLMIIGGALVTLGSVLTFSGWGFVIGIGLVIWGAIKVVAGVLGTVFNAKI